MKTFLKASLAVATSFAIATTLTACGEFEALTPKKSVANPEATPEAKATLVLADNLSEALAESLIATMQASPVAVYGAQIKDKKVGLQEFVNTFDLVGKNVVKGVSTQKVYRGNTQPDATGADKFDISVQVFARGAGVNRQLSFSNQLMSSVEGSTLGFVELEMISPAENLDKYIDCLDIAPALKKALRKENAFAIKAFAACLGANCDQVLVKLQLENRADVIKDSRVGLLFENKQSSDSKTESKMIDLTMLDSSIPEMLSYDDALTNKESSKLAEQCIGALDGSATATVQRPAYEEYTDDDAQAAADEAVATAAAAAEADLKRSMVEAYGQYAQSRGEAPVVGDDAAPEDSDVAPNYNGAGAPTGMIEERAGQ